MKKFIAVLLTLAMLLTAATVLAEDKVNLTAFQYSLENQTTDFNDLWYFNELEEKTGTHVDFEMVKDADYQTKLNLMFVSGSMKDMIIRGNLDIEDYGVTQELLLPLDEYLTEDIMPNYVPRLAMNHSGDSIPASDGKSYYIGYLVAQNVNHEGTWYINTKLQGDLGFETPTTIDQYTEIMRQMKAAGVKYPFSSSFTDYGPESLWNQFSSFGVPMNINTYLNIGDNNTVEFVGNMPGFRACLEWLHTLYAEGLMDPESLTQDSNLWADKVNAGDVGTFCYLRLINTAIMADNVGNFKSMLPPVSDGYKASVKSILEIPAFGAALTSSNANPVASLKWIDAQMETETMMVGCNGKMGEQMIINDAGKYEVIDIPADNGLYQFVPVAMGQFFAPGDYYTEIYQMAPHRVERYEDSIAYADAGVLATSYQYLSDLSKMGNDDAVEAANIRTELDKLVKEFTVQSVKDGVTDAGYEEFVKASKSIGVDEYIGLYQTAYNQYLAK